VYVYRNGVLAGSRTGITGGESLTADSAPFLLAAAATAAACSTARWTTCASTRASSPREIHDLYVSGLETTTLTQNTNGMLTGTPPSPAGLEATTRSPCVAGRLRQRSAERVAALEER
jgi:hypothetical protein